jgi:single-stranded DNA-binding protein
MSAHVIINGAIFRSPEQKISKSGKPFVVATIRAKDGETAQWWKVLTFSESAQAELLRLSDGDAVSAQGALRVETYERDGATKVSLTVMADQVLALRQSPKPRAKKESAPARQPRGAFGNSAQRARISCATDPALDDDVPF